MFDSRAVQKMEEAAAQVWSADWLPKLSDLLDAACRDVEGASKAAPQQAGLCLQTQLKRNKQLWQANSELLTSRKIVRKYTAEIHKVLAYLPDKKVILSKFSHR